MKVLVFGAAGQLGTDLMAALSAHNASAAGHDRADVADAGEVDRLVAAERPDWVINAAAMTGVDGCEDDVTGALAVNAVGARNVARAAARTGARLVQVSTDYVFDGAKGAPYVENDVTRPLNVYGTSKLLGEWWVADACESAYIVRTSGLYGTAACRGKGTNFVETILRLADERDRLTVVADEVLTPTLAADLAEQIRRLVDDPPAPGVYHATNAGWCSWYEFAVEIVERAGASVDVEPIRSLEWGAPARRPAFSVLEDTALAAAGYPPMPDWHDALSRYLDARRRR